MEDGSKWHLMSQCVYFAFKTIVFFGILLPKKQVFIKRNFQIIFFESFYVLYLQLPQYVIHFFIVNFEYIRIFERIHIWLDLCFLLKKCHNFKSYQNILTFSSLVFYIISFNFSLKTYILHHIICCKGFMNFLKTLILINTKLKKY
jgi:hypothetical protein